MIKILLIFTFLFSSMTMAQTKATKQLFKAIEKNNLHLATSAIQNGADVNGVDNIHAPTTNVLIKAIDYNRLDIVKLLLDNNADINQKRPVDLYTGLMHATHLKFAQAVKLLISRGADVNAESVGGRTALLIAAVNNSLEEARLLIQSKEIDVNARQEFCALAMAARKNNFGIVSLLKNQSGAKASGPVCTEKAIHFAELHHHSETLSILKQI